jgi:bacillithiol biosynthesis cysteine-adding enzyme BshC
LPGVASHFDALTSGLVRDSIPYTRLPWIRPLVEAATNHYDSVASLFPGNPSDQAAWQATIDRVTARPRDRQAIATVLQAQLTRRAAPAQAQTAASQLAEPNAVAVVTGQQAGLFGGPLYTLLKAVSTIQLARQARVRHGVPVVPVFWVDADDHDWNEIRTAHLLDKDLALASVTANDLPGSGVLPVGSLTFDATIAGSIDDLAAKLAPSEFTEPLLETLRTHYRAGTNPAAACAGWLDALLGAEGLVVFEASDPAAKRIAASVFAREFASPCATARMAREAGDRMTRAGHAPQIVPADDVVCVFRMDDNNGRLAIRCRDAQFVVGDREMSADDLRADAEAHPERFSANVLLRPIVQDTLFPTVCYVAGPSELAYHAQLGDIYRSFGVEAPLVACRASATFVDSAAARFFDRNGIALEAMQPQDESALNRLLASQMPAEVDEAFNTLDRLITDCTPRLVAAATAVDPTLAGAADTTVVKMRETVKNLQGKILQASKKKDETLRRQFIRTRTLTFPDGQPQERLLNVAYFINRYGFDLGTRLIEGLPVTANSHFVVVP